MSMVIGVEHANFFETHAIEYSKAPTCGNWTEVWDSFDNRRSAKVEIATNEDISGGTMFSRAGVVAE